ncbi:formate dehydrogenase accessory protein FdhE [Bordetella genomosp. 13]|uniref:formate dehydrogenase accessory protein FdhE n=1 Tax=Bordetella genomosp. 13 TaxID=463040 RepID=UPI0011AAD160|nr:formate dehydrogenase accessory protein FdhE [Bordetella genomosp. 13]
MQRILPRGEIEELDHNAIVRVRLPERGSVFAARAARLRQLATNNPVADYLGLMADLVEAQQALLAECNAPGADAVRIDRAQAHGMPPLQAVGWQRDPLWTGLLRRLAQRLEAMPDAPAEAIEVCQGLRRTLEENPAAIEAMADALIEERDEGVDSAAAPIVMAALQVYWTDLASRFDPRQLPVASPFGVCPVCGSLPVASVVRVGGQFEGYRYLCCSLCASEWHMVRVTCTHCEDTETVAYHAIEGRSEAVRAESCDRCHSYRKIFYQEKDLYVEPVADDLASLALDVLMGEAGYSRASGNPLLWHGSVDSEESAGADD